MSLIACHPELVEGKLTTLRQAQGDNSIEILIH